MKNKKLCAFIACLSCFTFCGSGIALARESIEVTNNFNTGVIDIDLNEYSMLEDGTLVPWEDGAVVLPGGKLSKIPRINNIGYDCYVRAKMDFSLDILEDSYYGLGENWVHAKDGYWYYTNVLEHGDYTDIFEGISIPTDLSQELEEANISLKIDVEAIQTNNFIPDYESESPWGDVRIEECIQDGNYEINSLKAENPKSFEIQYDKGSKSLIRNEDDFFANIPTLFPGDVYKDTLKLSNTSDKAIKLYFKTFNESSDLLSKIQLKITLGDKVIYQGSLDSKEIENEILLTTIKGRTSQELVYEIEVPKELGNEYTLLNDKVRWMFSVEEVESFLDTIKTGDISNYELWLLLMLVSLAMAVYMGMKWKHEENEKSK